MNAHDVRKKFIRFFEKRDHKRLDSSSLWPDDPSVLFTTAGMQQLKPFMMGTKDPEQTLGAKRFTSVQRCLRTSDIEEVGDATHCTFFEMLGNFSVGDYFKRDAIDFAWTFLTKELGLSGERLWATYYEGDESVKKDLEAQRDWGKFLPKERIIPFGKEENWWGPPGDTGPCGPCSEIHYEFTQTPCERGEQCLPNCACGRFMEIWNLVFMQFYQDKDGARIPLPKRNIDTGMGLERLLLVLQHQRDLYETDLFVPLIAAIRSDPAFGRTTPVEDELRCRIASDHLKASVFLLADGVTFSNKEQGYVLRRIFRRALDQYLHPETDFSAFYAGVVQVYGEVYPFLRERQADVLGKMSVELAAYRKVLETDINDLVKKIKGAAAATPPSAVDPPSRALTPIEAFTLFTTYGLSLDRLKREGFVFDDKKVQEEMKRHQEASRAGAKQKFGGHGLNSSQWSDEERQQMTRLHTATHLLHQALRHVLGQHVRQQGSDITPERLRFDFQHPQKMTDDQKQAVEKEINDVIAQDLPVTKEEMGYDEAMQAGALAFFKEKYGDRVTVYSVGDYSKELCGGPHVSHTAEIGTFRIVSEKSSSAGIRRIKAVVEK